MSSGPAATRSRDEIATAIRALTPADNVRLNKIAHRYAAHRPIEARDLLQEAFCRALDSRVCPAHVDIVRFLAEIMRSVAHGEAEKVENRLVLVPIAMTGGPQEAALTVADPAASAEDSLIDRQQLAVIRRDLLALFDDDAQARDIVEGIMEGLTGQELRELTDLDQTGYDSKRRLIRRRIDKAGPEPRS